MSVPPSTDRWRFSVVPIFFALYAYVGWLFFSGAIAGWQLFLYLFLLFIGFGLVFFQWSLDTIFWNYFSVGLFLPGSVAMLSQLPYRSILPVWWVEQPLTQWLVFLLAFGCGYLFFRHLRLPVADDAAAAPTSLRFPLRQLLTLLLMSIVLLLTVYPHFRSLFSYADIILHAQAIDVQQPFRIGIQSLGHFGYLPFSALQALTGMRLDILMFSLQFLLKFLAAAGTLLVFRRWFPSHLALVGAVLVFFYPPILVSFPQAFLANLGLAFVPFFFYFLTVEHQRWPAVVLALTFMVATMLTDAWFKGYLPLIAVIWSVYALIRGISSRIETVMTIIIAVTAVGVFIVSERMNIILINAQAHLFRNFSQPDLLTPTLAYLALVFLIVVLFFVNRRRDRTPAMALVLGCALLSLFISSLFLPVNGEAATFFGFVFCLSAWSVYACFRAPADHRPRPRFEHFFLVVLLVNVVMFFLLPFRLPFGNYGAFYLLPIPLAYFFLHALARWSLAAPRVAFRFMVAMVSMTVIGGLYYQFSYVSRIVYANPEAIVSAVNNGVYLLVLSLFVILSVWFFPQKRAKSS